MRDRRRDQPPVWVALPRGSRTGLTGEVANKILLALRNGSYRGPAARWAGIREETLSRWVSRGEKTKDEPYRKFAEHVREAEAYARRRMLNAITSPGPSRSGKRGIPR